MNTTSLFKYLLLSLLLLRGLQSKADDSIPPDGNEIIRPVMSSYTIEAGGALLADTYLTPLKYKGWALSLGYERMQAMKFNPKDWIMQLSAQANLDRTQNQVKNSFLWSTAFNFRWGMFRRFTLTPDVTIAVGGSASLNLGCLYLARNGNNPLSAKGALTVNLTALAIWNTQLGKLPVSIIYQPTLPLTGAFFSPDYGELYYEIYLGNHSGLVHPAWWGNYFSINNRLTADLHFGATSLRIGFASDILSTKINNITTRIITTQAIVGISGEWISLNPSKRLSPKARFIKAAWK